MANTLSWLHFSDLHIKGEPDDALGDLLAKLWKDLQRQLAALGKNPLDFVAFTGDIAFSGQPSEYEAAWEHFFRPLRDLLQQRFPRQNVPLLLVPGNHDQNRKRLAFVDKSGVSKKLTDDKAVEDLLTEPGNCDLILSSMAPYREFLRRLQKEGMHVPDVDGLLFSWAQPLAGFGESVAVIGLNSAWLSAYSKTDDEIYDHGRMVIGQHQLAEALKKVPPDSLPLVLAHHPLEALREFDAQSVRQLLTEKHAIFIHGHYHLTDVIEARGMGGALLTIPGAAIDPGSDKYLRGYALFQLDLAKHELRRFGRRWDPLHVNNFVDDVTWPTHGPGRRNSITVQLPDIFAPLPTVSDEDVTKLLGQVEPHWLARTTAACRALADFLRKDEKRAVWVGARPGNGLSEFIRLARALIGRKKYRLVWLDGRDLRRGIPIDEEYIVRRLEGTGLEVAPDEKLAGQRNLFRGYGATQTLLFFAHFEQFPPKVRGLVLEQWQEIAAENPGSLRAVFTWEGDGAPEPQVSGADRIDLVDITEKDEIEALVKEVGVPRPQRPATVLFAAGQDGRPVEAELVYVNLALAKTANPAALPHPVEALDKARRALIQWAAKDPLAQVALIWSLPPRLMPALAQELLTAAGSTVTLDDVRHRLTKLGILDEDYPGEWRIDDRLRPGLLEELWTGENAALATRLSGHLLAKLESQRGTEQPSYDLQEAYYATPVDPDKGFALYLRAYSHFRTEHQEAALMALAQLAGSQAGWMEDHASWLKLWRAVADNLAGDEDVGRIKQDLDALANDRDVPVYARIDALDQLATLAQNSRDPEAASKHLRRALDLLRDPAERPEEVETWFADLIKTCQVELAALYISGGGSDALKKADRLLRDAMQVQDSSEIAPEDPKLLRSFHQTLLHEGADSDALAEVSTRIRHMEDPAREAFLRQAVRRVDELDDLDNLYYVVSVLHHGLGYDQQRVDYYVNPDGSTEVTGKFALRAMSNLDKIDTYLTAGQSIRYEDEALASLNPGYQLNYRHSGEGKKFASLLIHIEPGLRPGDQLQYRWRAHGAERSMAAAPDQLEPGATFDYVAWHVIAPIRQLVLTLSMPSSETKTQAIPFFDLWRMGVKAEPGTTAYANAVQTAVRALIDEGQEQVKLEELPATENGRQEFRLTVQYPWLAMRYVLAYRFAT